MAQWLGQFSGHTHATKVEDAEESLRHAVTVFHTAEASDRNRKAKAVRRLAQRLLSARMKLLKARIVALTPSLDDPQKNYSGIDALRTREEQLRIEGVKGILAEFDALDAMT